MADSILLADNTIQNATNAIVAAKRVQPGLHVIGMQTAGAASVTYDFLPTDSQSDVTVWHPINDSSGAVTHTTTGDNVLVRLPDCKVRAVVATAAATCWVSKVDAEP